MVTPITYYYMKHYPRTYVWRKETNKNVLTFYQQWLDSPTGLSKLTDMAAIIWSLNLVFIHMSSSSGG